MCRKFYSTNMCASLLLEVGEIQNLADHHQTIHDPVENKFFKITSATMVKLPHAKTTRHIASTSMYSLTFCVRVMLPESHR